MRRGRVPTKVPSHVALAQTTSPPMTIGFSLFLIAVGAILHFAVTATLVGIDLQVVGVILMIVGVAGLAITFALLQRQRRRLPPPPPRP